MADKDDLSDCVDEGESVQRIEDIFEEWANMDCQEAYSSDLGPSGYFFLKVESTCPRRFSEKEWKRTCVDYLVVSYKYRRRHEYLTETMDLDKAQYDAFMDTFEWMYAAINPGRLKSRTMLARGW